MKRKRGGEERGDWMGVQEANSWTEAQMWLDHDLRHSFERVSDRT
jgi:hypothetical protein